MSKYIPIEDVAEILGVGVPTVRMWVSKGYIPRSTYIKAGSTYRFDVVAIEAALKDDAPPAPPQDDQEQDDPQQLELPFDDDNQ